MKLYRCLALLLYVLAGCSSLDRVDEMNNHRLQVGVSSKAEVVNAIGLPRQTEVDELSGQETWVYTGRPISKGYFIPLPIAAVANTPTTQTVHWSDIGSKNVVGNDPVMLTCVFDRNGQLILVKHNEKTP